MRSYDPNFLADLLDGLEAVPDSLYRAWMLEHDSGTGSAGSERRRRMQLGWLGFDQSQLLLLSVRNTLDSIQSMLATHWSGRKSEPDPVLPPGADDAHGSPRHVDATNVGDVGDYMRDAMMAFGMNG